ncbi:hypothetical protein ACIBH1_08205 [Nonomuraea sp. NPDC050663]|uniref:hypothetical protein n=1 Tax=Nonomuraea sp. NPDC050663 TaxID=3364370 RepID=UPI003794F3E9
MKILRNAAVVALGLVATLGVAPAPASADTYLIAQCAKNGYGIQVSVRYVTSGTTHHFNQVKWRISGTVGGNNTIRVSFMQDAQPDILFKALNYTGGKTGERNISVSRPKGHQVFVKFAALFDTSASSDPSCTYHTRGI